MSEQDYEPNAGQIEEEEAAIADFAAEEATLRAELEAMNEKLLRMAAELENNRRRAEREKQDASRYAIAGFARDLLAVADNFERALQLAPADDDTLSADGLKGLLTGVRMTEKALQSALDKHGVRRIDPQGERFDPHLHQAVAQTPAAGVPAGSVAVVAQPGFVLGDRVLRAAMVVVSTGEPPSAAGNPAAASPAEEPCDAENQTDGPAPIGGRVDTSA